MLAFSKQNYIPSGIWEQNQALPAMTEICEHPTKNELHWNWLSCWEKLPHPVYYSDGSFHSSLWCTGLKQVAY